MEDVLMKGVLYDEDDDVNDFLFHVIQTAVELGNLDVLCSFQEMGLENSWELTWILFDATEKGNERIMEAAIDLGADVNGRMSFNCTSICVAASASHILLNHGADLYSVDDHNQAALHYADSAEAAVALLTRGSDANTRGQFGRIPLFCVKDIETMNVLINYGASLDARDDRGQTALHVQATCTDKNAVNRLSLLLSAGAAVTDQDNDGNTPLHCALWTRRNNIQACISAFQRSLSKKTWGDLFTVANCRGETVLHAVPCCTIIPSVLNQKDSRGRTALHCAVCDALQRDVSKVETLLSVGASPDEKHNDGNTPLHIAARYIDIGEALVEGGADVNVPDSYGRTALHIAVASSNDKLTRFLLSVPTMKVNARDNNGWTALHYATRQSAHVKAVQALLEHGADKSLLDNTGHDAAHYATKKTVIKLLARKKRKRE